MLTLQVLVVIFLVSLGSLALKTLQSQCVFIEDRRSLQVINNFFILFKWASYLFPGNEFRDLFGELPELLKVDVAIR